MTSNFRAHSILKFKFCAENKKKHRPAQPHLWVFTLLTLCLFLILPTYELHLTNTLNMNFAFTQAHTSTWTKRVVERVYVCLWVSICNFIEFQQQQRYQKHWNIPGHSHCSAYIISILSILSLSTNRPVPYFIQLLSSSFNSQHFSGKAYTQCVNHPLSKSHSYLESWIFFRFSVSCAYSHSLSFDFHDMNFTNLTVLYFFFAFSEQFQK